MSKVCRHGWTKCEKCKRDRQIATYYLYRMSGVDERNRRAKARYEASAYDPYSDREPCWLRRQAT